MRTHELIRPGIRGERELESAAAHVPIESIVQRETFPGDARRAAGASRIEGVGSAFLLRSAVACVWLYHGLWAKLIAPRPDHLQVVVSVPRIDAHTARLILTAIGLFETALALWVLNGRAPRRAALAQTVSLTVMNTAGLLWGRAAIADPGGMVVANIAFLALAWRVALQKGRRDANAA